MGQVELRGGSFILDGRPTFLFGGELHYFRLDPGSWAERIALARRLNLNAIASYVPWIWHEPTSGSFDFTGTSHPARNLVRFLDLVQEAGLFFIARIGPVSNAELVGEGIPPWVFSEDPDRQLLKADGSYLAGMPSYRHPSFQERVRRWYDALMPHLVPRLSTHGGHIPLVQLCNEIDMPTWLGRQPDFHAHVSQAYGDFVGDPGAQQPDGWVATLPSARHTAWMDFYAREFARYAQDLALGAKLDVPVMVNLAQWKDFADRGRGLEAPLTATMFRDMAQTVPQLVLGGDYYPRRLDYENFHDVVIATEIVRMISDHERPVVCPELQTGGNEDRPRLYASDVELLLQTSAGHGLNALNAYMLAGGSNPEGIGLFGVEHDWQAPIGPSGDLRPHSDAIARFGAFLASHPDFAGTQKRFDTTIGIYLPYFQTEYLRGGAIEALERRRADFLQDGWLRMLSLANLQYRMVDLQRAPQLGETLWVYCEDWMAAPTQALLASFVQAGGKLVLFPTVPTRGLDGEPCALLAEALGSVPEDEATRYVRVEGTSLPLMGHAQTFATREGDAVLGQTDSGRACCLLRPVARGAVLLMGYGMKHRWDRQVAIARAWAAKLGIDPRLQLDQPEVIGVVRAHATACFVTLCNYHDVATRVSGTVAWQGERVAIAAGAIDLERRSARTIRVSVPAS